MSKKAKKKIENFNPPTKTQQVIHSFNKGIKESVDEAPDPRKDPAGYTEWALAKKLEEIVAKRKH